MQSRPAPSHGESFRELPLVLAPHRALLTYYTLSSFLLGPAFFIVLLPLYFRFRTIRYRIDEEGITMSWGFLFRREISLTYARIQDIHLSSNIVERWLGLGKVQIQTASGNAGAEMTIEGLQDFAEIRDFLYARMRGARPEDVDAPAPPTIYPAMAAPPSLASILHEVAAEIRALRHEVRQGRAASDPE